LTLISRYATKKEGEGTARLGSGSEGPFRVDGSLGRGLQFVLAV